MTTIGQLPPAASVSDSDELAIYQNGQTLSATRGQLLAGVQTTVTLPQNTLLGGLGPGIAAATPINIGSNLQLFGSTLSATASPFEISALPTGTVPAAGDVVAVSQNSQNQAVSYVNFMSGLQDLANISGANLTATANEGTTVRTISQLAGNAVSIEDFGAVGDGVTDDSAALLGAISSGQAVRLGAKTYAIAGECDITGANCTIIGVPGISTLKRSAQSKIGSSVTPAWISISCTSFYAENVIFDANTAVESLAYAVAVQAVCTKTLIKNCVFKNANNGNYGYGLIYLPSDPAVTSHQIESCEFCFNVMSGLYVLSSDAVSIINCRSHDNQICGIEVDSKDPSFVLKARYIQVVGNTCWNNSQVGIKVGNFVANNIFIQPFDYGNENPDILGAVISANNCYSNGIYGIYISGKNILVSGNLCANNSTKVTFGAGILAATAYCKISGNMIAGATNFGIDSGGSQYNTIDSNYIFGPHIGLNVGGSQSCRVRSNFLQDCNYLSINVENVESDGSNDNFGLACNGLSISGNWISYRPGAGGITILDAAQNICVEDNTIFIESGGSVSSALTAYTDSIVIRRNLVNFTPSYTVNPTMNNGVYTLIVPDILDAVSVSQSNGPVASTMTMQAVQAAGTITFIKVTNGGYGYTTATVSIQGNGSNATAEAWISNGQVIGIQMGAGANGSGYDSETSVTISGDGVGATAVVQVGLPPWQGKQLTVNCAQPVMFAAAGASPAQMNWTGAPITVPAGASVEWSGMGEGGWQAVRFTQNDYVSPNGDGSLTLKTQAGDISIQPAQGGALRLLSSSEPTGAVELIGRGSPQNIVSAPAGSTFRNLNGGAGVTFWVKQMGTGPGNWVAVA